MDNENIAALRKKHFLPTAGHYHEEPLQLRRASGVSVWDENDREYLDAIGGIVCISVGHHHPKIKKALMEMLDREEIQHTSTLYFHPAPMRLVENLLRHTPEGLTRFHFTNSGSEANETAFLAARNGTGENTVVNVRHSYHGGTAGTLANCGHHTWRFRAQPVTSVTSVMEPYCYRCPFGKKPGDCGLECAKNIESTIQTTTHGKIAAMIAEPVMGVGGFITPPKEYFEEAIRITHRYGGKFISDEVQTGSGRTGGELFLSKEWKLDVDAITTAKGLGNGAAIGAVMMTEEMAIPMAGKMFFNTFGSDPYPTLQAALTIEILEEEHLIENARQMGALLMDGLKTMMNRHSLIGEVRGRGLLIGVELVRDRETKEHATVETAKLLDECKKRGLLLGKGGLKGNVIRIAPPLMINRSQAERLLTIFDESLRAVSHHS